MEMHVEKLVKGKQAAISKATKQALCAAVLVIVGGVMRHTWGVPGELVVAVGLLMCGWFARGMFDASKIDTRFNG